MTTSHTFTKFGNATFSKLANLASDTLKVALLTAYTPAVDTHEFWSDVLGAGTEVASGGGYTTGGLSLTSVTLTNSGHAAVLSCANPSWGVSLTASFAVFYDSTPGTSATDPVFVYWDFGGSQTLSGLTISGSGLLTATGTG